MTTPQRGTDGTAAGPSTERTAEPRPPVVCDMTGAPDTGPARLAEYAQLFETAYLGRERDQTGARWLLRADPGVEEWARDLADRENACCAFMTSTVTREGDLVIWHSATTGGEAAAKAVIDLFYDLPLQRPGGSGVADTLDRWSSTGVPIVVRDADVERPATAAEIREGLR